MLISGISFFVLNPFNLRELFAPLVVKTLNTGPFFPKTKREYTVFYVTTFVLKILASCQTISVRRFYSEVCFLLCNYTVLHVHMSILNDVLCICCTL